MVRGPERAAGRAGRGDRRISRRFQAAATGTPVERIRPTERDARTGDGRCNRAAESTAERGESVRRAPLHRAHDGFEKWP